MSLDEGYTDDSDFDYAAGNGVKSELDQYDVFAGLDTAQGREGKREFGVETDLR